MSQQTMQKSECAHILGMLRHTDYSELVTVDRLVGFIKQRNELNEMYRTDPCFTEIRHLIRPQWTMKHYADFRRNTNLARFLYCPLCGERINWKELSKIEV